MESKTKNRKTPEEVTRMVSRAFAGVTLAAGENALNELKEGWFNAAYNIKLSDGREIILKIAPPEDVEILAYEKNIMATEVNTMRLVSQNPAIPVPEIYYFDNAHDLCDSNYFFMEKLSGDNYEYAKKTLPLEIQTQIDQNIGVIIREINGFSGNYFGYDGNSALRADTWKEAFSKIIDSVLEDGARKTAEYGFEIDEIRHAVLKHSPSLESVTTPKLVHWDAWDSNFFVRDGKVSGIFDFERALWGDPLLEAQFRTSGEVSESMHGYGKITFSAEETVRCHLYDLFLALVMKTECYYRNYDNDYVSNIATKIMVPTMKWLQEN